MASTVITPKSDEFVLDLLSVTEEKLVKLYEDLDAQGMSEQSKTMRDDFMSIMEAKLPPNNTRVTMPSKNMIERTFEDEDPSGDESAEDFRGYRDQIKQASKQIVDIKTKRHLIKKNKK